MFNPRKRSSWGNLSYYGHIKTGHSSVEHISGRNVLRTSELLSLIARVVGVSFIRIKGSDRIFAFRLDALRLIRLYAQLGLGLGDQESGGGNYSIPIRHF